MQPGEAKPSSRKFIRILLACLFCVLCLVLFFYWFNPVLGLVDQTARTRTNEKRLKNNTNYREVALACIQLIHRLGTNELIALGGTDASLPQPIRSLEASRVHVHTNQVKIIFGGGFHHYGFLLMVSPEETNSRAELHFWADSEAGQKLMTLSPTEFQSAK